MDQTIESEPTRPSPPSARQSASRRDEQVFGEFLERFAVLAESCFRLSREVYARAEGGSGSSSEEALERSLGIVRRIFAGRLMEILAVLSVMPSVGFQEIQGLLGHFTQASLAEKLGVLEAAGLIQRESASDPPEDARYILTHKGVIILHLGEPVLLYLRLAEGWSSTSSEAKAAPRA